MEGAQRTRTAGRRKRERKEGGKKGNVRGEWSMANMDWSIKLQVIPIIFKWSIRLLHWLDQSWQNEIETEAQKVKCCRKLASFVSSLLQNTKYSIYYHTRQIKNTRYSDFNVNQPADWRIYCFSSSFKFKTGIVFGKKRENEAVASLLSQEVLSNLNRMLFNWRNKQSSVGLTIEQLINICLIVALLVETMKKMNANQTKRKKKSVEPIIIHNKDGWLSHHRTFSRSQQTTSWQSGTLDWARI